MIGTTLGHYEIQGSIGSGAMGLVYRARDTRLGRDVALKLLPTALRGNPKALDRFRREAKALATLNHPNIVTIFAIEEEEEDLFLTMELVEGRSLDNFISEAGMEIEAFKEIAVPLADALAAAHASGVVHRDLKPSNIMISADGRLKVLDFGVARVLSDRPLTDANIAVGTAAYMSPEQISGGDVDGRSDIFSLGIVFVELLTCWRPFLGEHPAAVMYSIVNESPSGLAVLPDSVAAMIDRCLKKNPADRYGSAAELRSTLQGLTVASAPSQTRVEASSETQAAFDRGDWETVRRTLLAISEQRELTAEELEMLGEAQAWLYDTAASNQALEKAYVMYSRSGQNVSAARVALDLSQNYTQRSASTVARGWQSRAERLLKGEPESIVHGRLLRQQAKNALVQGDLELATQLNQQCGEIADRLNDRDLLVESLHDRGQILIAGGQVEEGTALVDEAMTSAMSGEVSHRTTGNLFCRTMMVCASLADYHRASEWSEAAWRWCEPFGTSAFNGICRIQNAEIMRHQGRWEEAEQAARRAYDDFSKNGSEAHAGAAVYEIGELALRRGNFEIAESSFREAHNLGHDPAPGLPLLLLAQGKSEAAAQILERAMNETQDDHLRRAKLLAASVPVALANNQPAVALTAVEELTEISKEFSCPCFTGHAMMGRGAIELQRGDHQAATRALREAWSIFQKLSFPYDAARVRTLLGQAYFASGNPEDARLQLEAAGKTFRELDAGPDLQLASDLLEAGSQSQS
jgi:serine/threonine protein kinase